MQAVTENQNVDLVFAYKITLLLFRPRRPRGLCLELVVVVIKRLVIFVRVGVLELP